MAINLHPIIIRHSHLSIYSRLIVVPLFDDSEKSLINASICSIISIRFPNDPITTMRKKREQSTSIVNKLQFEICLKIFENFMLITRNNMLPIGYKLLQEKNMIILIHNSIYNC